MEKVRQAHLSKVMEQELAVHQTELEILEVEQKLSSRSSKETSRASRSERGSPNVQVDPYMDLMEETPLAPEVMPQVPVFPTTVPVEGYSEVINPWEGGSSNDVHATFPPQTGENKVSLQLSVSKHSNVIKLAFTTRRSEFFPNGHTISGRRDASP